MYWLLSRHIRKTYGEEVHSFIYGWLTLGCVLVLSYMFFANAIEMRREQHIQEHWEPNQELLRKLEEMK